jgi:hypothetical protein
MDSLKPMKLKPVTVDFRKSGYEDLYDYVEKYAEQNCNGRMASAILDIIRDHHQNNIPRSSIFVVQGDRIIAKG